ncbi:hypothetical protein Golob_017022, partial [Gossypium lobatum]|nr:hypothetical protein [Gossypium lobatum]
VQNYNGKKKKKKKGEGFDGNNKKSKGHGRQASAVGMMEEDFGTSYSPTVAHPQGYQSFLKRLWTLAYLPRPYSQPR